MGYKNTATAHGFRALFSTVANECGWNPDVIERQLAHKEANEVRAAYHRSAYMEERVRLMQWWADYLDARLGWQGIEDAPAGRLMKTPVTPVTNPRNPVTMRVFGRWGTGNKEGTNREQTGNTFT
jgi:hypothetical protein